MVFQNYALYPHMTVRENLEYGLKKHRVPRDERQRRVGWASDMLQLQGLLQRKPRQLSGGQQQRVALGRAMVREPKAFLLDEPLSNLDARLRLTMRAGLIRLHHAIGTTMIYVTHDQVEAMSMSQRIAVMRDGRVQQYDRPDGIYKYPANLFVANFIGSPSMNLFQGELTSRKDGQHFLASGLDLALPDAIASRLIESDSQAVTLGVRPEDVFLHLSDSPLRLLLDGSSWWRNWDRRRSSPWILRSARSSRASMACKRSSSTFGSVSAFTLQRSTCLA